MNQHIVRSLRAGCLALAVSFPAAFGQAGELVTADVPFAFQVNNNAFPAGKYRVTSGSGQAALLVQSIDFKQAVFSFSNAVQGTKTWEAPRLVFRRYGDRYFLSQVWLPGSDRGRELPIRASERAVARNWAKPGTETVAVAKPANESR